jgi:uncharacterized membrane protein YfcA
LCTELDIRNQIKGDRKMPLDGSILILLLIGIVAGIMSGFFGIGGGVIIVPALVYLIGFTQHKATGTSLAVLLPPVGVAAVLEYYRRGNVDLRVALIVAIGLLSGAWVGAHFANRLSGPSLRFAFGIFVVLVGLYITYGAARQLSQS